MVVSNILHRLRQKMRSSSYQRIVSKIKPIDPKIYGLARKDKIRREGYFSQCGQDKWLVEEVFQAKRGGVFVDIGAHDGITLSNTYFLEKELGWTGLAVEPIPEVYDELKTTRNCITVNGCVGASNGIVIFRIVEGYSEMLSGIVDEYHQNHVARIEREIDKFGGRFRDTEVSCFGINDLLSKHGLYDIDYLSIDIEGGELKILEALDCEKYRIQTIGVENNYRDVRIPKIMKKKGFELYSIVGDEFYMNKGIPVSRV